MRDKKALRARGGGQLSAYALLHDRLLAIVWSFVVSKIYSIHLGILLGFSSVMSRHFVLGFTNSANSPSKG